MTPTFFIVRHAETTLNDPENERIRGYSDVPIDHAGTIKTHQAGKFLASYPIVHILASPLQRGMMSAHIISEATGAEVRPSRGLLPWDLGIFTEKPIAEVAKDMDYYQEYPDIRVPNGESYRNFYNRWADQVHNLMAYAEKHQDENVVAVTHSRNLLSLPSVLGNTGLGDVPVKGGPDPASVTKLWLDGNTWKSEVVYK